MVVYQTAFRQVKRSPLCVCRPPHHPCSSRSNFSLSLGVPAGSEVIPQNLRPEPCPCSLQPGVGKGLVSGGDPSLIRPCAPAEKAAGTLGALLFGYCLSKEEQERGSQRPRWALAPALGEKVPPCPFPGLVPSRRLCLALNRSGRKWQSRSSTCPGCFWVQQGCGCPSWSVRGIRQAATHFPTSWGLVFTVPAI